VTENVEKQVEPQFIRGRNSMMKTMKAYKWLLMCSAILLLGAFILRYVQLSKPVSQWLGGIELLFAIAMGIAFGWKATQSE
jgi:hypothetical protein